MKTISENTITINFLDNKKNLNKKKYFSEKKLIKRLLHATLREEFLNYRIVDDLLIVNLPKTQKKIVCTKAKKLSLGKIKIEGDVILITKKKYITLTKVKSLLKIIYEESCDNIDTNPWKQFVKEIANCGLHEALVFPFIENEHRFIAEKINEGNYKNFIDYIAQNYSTEEQCMFFEFWAVGGHPYHPCHKTKLGFTPQDYLKYSPEFHNDVALSLGAIDKNLICITGEKDSDSYQKWFAQEFPEQWENWKQEMNANQISVSDYCPFFVHPWQLENVLPELFKQYFETGKLKVFENKTIITKPSLSFRTLAVKKGKNFPHIKLPVAVYSTSAMRTITPSSIHNGPAFCAVLKEILKEENAFQNTLKMSHEICGFYPHSFPTNIAKNFGIIFRKNPASLVEKNEVPIVVAALFEKSPVSGLPLFVEMIHASLGKEFSNALSYFDDYSKIVLNSYFDIFLVYGVALEGHQQNTIAVFENYRPKYMIVRDFGGIRIHMPTLNERGYNFDAHPESSIIYEDKIDVTATFLHTVLQYHLGELISLLAEHYQVSEQIFWKKVRINLKQRLEALKNRVSAETLETEHKAILEDDWKMKGLMRMRLKNDAYHYESITIPNPLRDA